MTTNALVGPLPTIHFGPPRRRIRVAYTVPRNTMDPRHALCTDHHPACDCREAELNERISEYGGEQKALLTAASTVLRGHRIYDHGDDRVHDLESGSDEWWRLIGGDGPLACQCTGCQIVRATHAYVRTDRDGVVE